MSDRLIKIEKLLSVEVAKIIKEEIETQESIVVTIVRAKVSRTLEHATIFISILPEPRTEEIFAKINKQIYFIQQRLNKKLFMHPVPKIRFELDTSEEQAEKITKLIEKL